MVDVPQQRGQTTQDASQIAPIFATRLRKRTTLSLGEHTMGAPHCSTIVAHQVPHKTVDFLRSAGLRDQTVLAKQQLSYHWHGMKPYSRGFQPLDIAAFRLFLNPLLLLLLKKRSAVQGWERVIYPYQSADPSPTILTYRQKEEKGKESRRL